MAAAKRRGRKFGRPRKLTNAKVKWARQALKGQQAMTFRKASQRLNVSTRTLRRALRNK
jgi:hypothetical protein